MLGTIKNILGWAYWITLFLYVITFGILVIPMSHWAGILILVFITTFFCGLLIDKFVFRSKHSVTGKPFGGPVVDVALLVFSVMSIIESNQWRLLFIIGCVMLFIDLILWFISQFVDNQDK